MMLHCVLQASPLVSSVDVAYVASDMGDLMAVDAASGDLVWRRWLGNPIKGSPALSDDEKVRVLINGLTKGGVIKRKRWMRCC